MSGVLVSGVVSGVLGGVGVVNGRNARHGGGGTGGVLRAVLSALLCVLLLVSSTPSCHGQSGVTLQSATLAVQQTPLAPPPTSSGVVGDGPTWENSTSDSTQGFVVSGSFSAASTTTLALHKESWALSQLYAQYAANAVTDRFDDTKTWYTTYVQKLGELGWAYNEFNFTQQKAEGQGFQMNINLKELMAAVATGDEAAIFVAMMDSLHNDTTGSYQLFEHDAVSDKSGNFQCSEMTTTDDGVASVGLSASYYSADQSETQILWVDWSQYNLQWFASHSVLHLDDDVFPIDELRQKLKDYINAAIKTTELKPPSTQ